MSHLRQSSGASLVLFRSALKINREISNESRKRPGKWARNEQLVFAINMKLPVSYLHDNTSLSIGNDYPESP